MKSKELVIVTLILLGFNIWLLYTNDKRQEQIDLLNSQIQSLNTVTKANSTDWGIEQEGNTIARIIHPEVHLNTEGTTLSIYFTDQGCSFCIENEVENLNKLWKKYPQKIKIFLMSYNKFFLKRLYGAVFSYKVIAPEEKLLDNNFSFANPIAILSDENNIVQLLHIAEKDNEVKSDKFYQRMNSLLESL